jgi:prevent-host-death family protein
MVVIMFKSIANLLTTTTRIGDARVRWGMPKRISASQAKTQFGSMVDWAVESQDDIIVESRGRPRAVIMSFEAYEKLAALRSEARRREALAQVERLRERVRARNADMDGATASDLGDRLAREVIGEMVAEGKVKYDASDPA